MTGTGEGGENGPGIVAVWRQRREHLLAGARGERGQVKEEPSSAALRKQ